MEQRGSVPRSLVSQETKEKLGILRNRQKSGSSGFKFGSQDLDKLERLALLTFNRDGAATAPVWFLVSVLFPAVLGIKPRPSHTQLAPLYSSFVLVMALSTVWNRLSACVYDPSLTQPHEDAIHKTAKVLFSHFTCHASDGD